MAADGGGRPQEEGGEVEEHELDAQDLARRRAALAQIRQYPDAVLRMRAREVEVFDEDLARLADRMGHLMHDARGVGLAATQVGVLQRLFVFHKGDDEGLTTVVNPEIASRSKDTAVFEEGCLSLQGVLVPVERAVKVTLVGADVQGNPLELSSGSGISVGRGQILVGAGTSSVNLVVTNVLGLQKALIKQVSC